MTFQSDQLVAMVAGWLLPLFRIAAVVGVAPVFGNRAVPIRVKGTIVLALGIAIIPLVPPVEVVDPFSATGMLTVVHEVLIGLTFGFAMRLVFVVMEIAGQLIAHLMGLGFAAMVDPQSGIDVPVLSQFYIILATLVFLGLDGHLIMVGTLAESFRVLPIGLPELNPGALWTMAGKAGWVFAAALQLALPAIVTLLVVNLAFGVISRAAPQLHVVVIGFPLTLLFGFVIIWLSYSTLVGELPAVLGVGFERAQGVFGGFR